MMEGYFNDDGTPFNPNLMPKLSLCSTCKNDNDPKQEIACNLNRNDQTEDIFLCFSYEPNSSSIDGKAVIQEMENYMNQKYGGADLSDCGQDRCVKLSDIVEEMDIQMSESTSYLNKKTGTIVIVSDEEMRVAEDEENIEELPDWQKENIKVAHQILETDDYLALPSQFDIDNYAIMEKFCWTIDDEEIRGRLCEVIQGRGAFRRFKDSIVQHNIEKDWYQYKHNAFCKIAKHWCEDHKIKFVEG